MQQLAQRATTLTPSLTLAIDAKAKKMQADGIDVCGFGAGEPDFDTPQHIKDAAAKALADGFTKYTPSSGIPELRAAIAEKLKNDNGLDYKPSQIIVNCGAKHSCYNAILATCQAGDEVIIPAPYWLSYPEMVKLADATPVIVQTSEANGFKITPDEFHEAMTPATKLIIINSPGNPTGSVYAREELQALSEVALEEEILILSDEVYEKITYDNTQHVSFASLGNEVYDLTMTVNGFSKTYAMTGWRLGYAIVPDALVTPFSRLIVNSVSCTNAATQWAGVEALTGPQDAVDAMVTEFKARRDLIVDGLNSIPGVTCLRPEGAFYVFPDISATGLTGADLADRLLNEGGVSALAGTAFGHVGLHHLRFSYANSRENIAEAVRRTRTVIEPLVEARHGAAVR